MSIGRKPLEPARGELVEPRVRGSSFDRLRTSGVVIALIAAACSPPAERLLLEQFFAASRLRDKTALQQIATVMFEPREQGTIAAFDITNVDPRREGERELKDVTVAAPVRLPTRETVQQTLVVRMEKIGGRWLITSVKPVSLTTQND